MGKWGHISYLHVFNRGHNRETVFVDDDYRHFLNLHNRYAHALNIAFMVDINNSICQAH